jgi:hypothetical protein
MDNATRQRKIEQYGQAYTVLIEALHTCPPEMWTFKSSPDEWCIQEVIVHLADSEVNAYVRCRRAIAEPGGSVMAYDQARWAEALHYMQQDGESALQLFRYLRALTHALLKSLPESTWANTIQHPEVGVMTLDDWLDTYAAHAHNHVDQINTVCAAWRAQA